MTCMWYLSGWSQMGFWQISAFSAGHPPSSRDARSRAADYERVKKTSRLDEAHTPQWWSDYSSHFLIRWKHLEEKNQGTDNRFIRLTSGMLCRGPVMLALLKPIASEQQGAAAAAAHKSQALPLTNTASNYKYKWHSLPPFYNVF